MSRFPRLRKMLQAIVIASLPLAATACCGPAPQEKRTEIIDPEAPIYKPLVQACIADDLSCGDLCEEILRQRGVEEVDSVSFQECRIMDQAATQVQMTYTFPYDCVGGRRPDGLGGCLPDEQASPAAKWFAQMAHLEGAAVYAFANTARQLARLGAPEELVKRAIVAADQEVVHAMLMTRLAREQGTEPPAVVVSEPDEMSLFELARENAVEGCVRETYGALVATYQARTAREPHVRAALARIADDETEHAELSAAIDDWAMAQLSEHQRQDIDDARDVAVQEVLASARKPVDPTLAQVIGLPDASTATTMASALFAA